MFSDVTRHFQAGEQFGVADFAAHLGFIRAGDLVGGVEARPLLDELVTDGLLAVEALLGLLRDVGVVEGHAALLSDPSADLFHIEIRDAVDNRHQHELRAERQQGREDHDTAP